MSSKREWSQGEILWQDLTVSNAAEIRDFYQAVIGWEVNPESMGDYEDYHMVSSSTGENIAGICHARGINSDLPPVWLIYILVDNVDKCAMLCEENGGEVIVGPRRMGATMFCVIRDPAGAICALYQPQE